jgi:hypothetical protein
MTLVIILVIIDSINIANNMRCAKQMSIEHRTWDKDLASTYDVTCTDYVKVKALQAVMEK